MAPLAFALMLSFSTLNAQSIYEGTHGSKVVVKSLAPIQARAFNLSEVTLVNSQFTQNQDRSTKWLLSLDIDRLLLSFRVNAGLHTKYAKPLGGWEQLSSEVRGHTMGHVLSGLAISFGSTGNKAFKHKADSLVSELAIIQEALNQDGYLSAFPQKLIDRVISGTGAWAPWYTVHKILAGLLDTYIYADNDEALEIAKKMADWAYVKLQGLTQLQLDSMLNEEFGGCSESFFNLYAMTGKSEYLKLAKMFFHGKVLNPLAEGKDILQNHHANTYIPKIIGEARGYELTGDSKKREIAEFFWNTVVNHHTYATGGNSDHELFFAPDSISNHITARTTETCNSYNMLKLTNHLFTWEPKVKYADYYEKVLFNHILGSQDPETGMVCYFMPFTSGLFKVYSTKENSFWCCVGTGFENHSKYNEAIYFHSNSELYVNQFIPSLLKWKEKGIELRLETNFPEEDRLKLIFSSAMGETIAVRLRYPSWAKSASITVNGKKITHRNERGDYISIARAWKTGDVIEAVFPMTFDLITSNDNVNKGAVAYGPIVLVGAMGNSGVVPPAPYANESIDYNNYEIPKNISYALFPKDNDIMKWNINSINAAMPLTFQYIDKKNEITLIPYFRLHHQRYVMYWDVK